MGQHLLLAVRLHGDGQGTARYHGTWEAVPEWPPAPARVFQALVAGGARGSVLPEALASALEWLESLPPPVIAAPRSIQGERISLFVPNNDADALPDPRDVSGIRTKKVVHPTLLEDKAPLLYAWPLAEDTTHAGAIVLAANDLYQLGRGVDMAWAVGELVDDEALTGRLREHSGTIHHPQGRAFGKGLACPMPGSLASLLQRHQAAKLHVEGNGGTARFLFTNAPKSRFMTVTYERARHRVVYELRNRLDDGKTWSCRLHRASALVESLRDGAVERLRQGLPNEHTAIDQTLIGRQADGSNPSPPELRARIVPLPSIGHEKVDRSVRRILLEVPSGAPLRPVDVEWAFSGLETASSETGVVGPFVLTRAEADNMLRHYDGPSRRWRSVTAVVLPEGARRRRIDPARKRDEAKNASERSAEEDRAVAAIHVALRHAGIRGTMVAAHVQREPFEARGARAEAFAEGTRFAKERLWHVDLELDTSVEGPLVIGDGRFLGLGVMAPVTEPWSHPRARGAKQDGSRKSPTGAPPSNRSGLLCFTVGEGAKDHPLALARALRRAVMARVQVVLRGAPLGRFFSGHEDSGDEARSDHANHLAFQWDPTGQRLFVIAPHWLDRREPFADERRAIARLDEALEGFFRLRAGAAGCFELSRHSLSADDPLLAAARTWVSVTPYAVTRHRKHASATEVLIDDVIVECYRTGLPRPKVTVLDARGIPGTGLVGRVRLDFASAVAGPIILGRTRYLGGGLFAPKALERQAPH